MRLSFIQQQIVDMPGNLIVRASAGAGKTHTMVSKIAAEIEKIIHIKSSRQLLLRSKPRRK